MTGFPFFGFDHRFRRQMEKRLTEKWLTEK